MGLDYKVIPTYYGFAPEDKIHPYMSFFIRRDALIILSKEYLKQDLDIIIINSSWVKIPDEIRKIILEKVKEGTGLHLSGKLEGELKNILKGENISGGGFVFTTVHNIQSDVPVENIMAMWETLQKYGKY